MTRAARALINLGALRHNLKRVRAEAPRSRVMSVVKADAYGHGVREVVQALSDTDGFAVANVPEAVYLRELGVQKPVLALQGISSDTDLVDSQRLDIQVMIHHSSQLDLLEATVLRQPIGVWLKIDTGMHRLGFQPGEAAHICKRVYALSNLNPPPVLMTHLACADDRNALTVTKQVKKFDHVVSQFAGEKSIANSGGILGFPETHRNWVRPGIMLYGASPFINGDAKREGLAPVMTLKAPLIAVRHCRRGEAIGYGGSYVCTQDMLVGVVAIGYGDGYPRHAPSGTPVLLHGKRVPLAGRVSMDMITIDLRAIESPKPGDEVILWGAELSVDEVARWAGTISYELLCHTGQTVRRITS